MDNKENLENEDYVDEVIDIDENENIEEEGIDGDAEGFMMEDMEEVRDDSTCTFELHKEPIFCIRFNPVNSALVATGGQDDMAYVWNSVSGDVVLKCTGHKDSVSHVSFSTDGSLLATGDMSGLIQVWHISTEEMVWSFEVADLEWMNWHSGTKVLLASDSEGTVWMWKIPSGDCKTFSNSGVAATCCELLPGGSTLVTGYSNGVIKVWDLVSAACKLTISGNEGHQAQITSLSVASSGTENSNLLLSGSVDGMVHVYNYKTGKLLKSFSCNEDSGQPPAEGEEDEGCSVEAVSLCTSRPLAAAGTNTGLIYLYDMKSQTCIHKINNNMCPVTKIQWHFNSPLLYASDASGVISLWDGRTGESTAKFYGHIAEIHDIAVSKEGVIFASASEDGTAKIYAVSQESAAS